MSCDTRKCNLRYQTARSVFPPLRTGSPCPGRGRTNLHPRFFVVISKAFLKIPSGPELGGNAQPQALPGSRRPRRPGWPGWGGVQGARSAFWKLPGSFREMFPARGWALCPCLGKPCSTHCHHQFLPVSPCRPSPVTPSVLKCHLGTASHSPTSPFAGIPGAPPGGSPCLSPGLARGRYS